MEKVIGTNIEGPPRPKIPKVDHPAADGKLVHVQSSAENSKMG